MCKRVEIKQGEREEEDGVESFYFLLSASEIAAGGPVTVTHPHMRRFIFHEAFPKRSQLVLQASPPMGKDRGVRFWTWAEP